MTIYSNFLYLLPNQHEIPELLYYVLKFKHREPTAEEQVLLNKFVQNKSPTNVIRSRHYDIVNTLNSKGKLVCKSFSLCNRIILTIEKEAHLNTHLNRQFEVTPYFESLLEADCTEIDFIKSIKELQKLLLKAECGSKTQRSEINTKNHTRKQVYVVKLVDKKSNKHSRSYSEPRTLIEHQLVANKSTDDDCNVNVKSLINSFQRFTENITFDFPSKFKRVSRSRKSAFNSTVYIGHTSQQLLNNQNNRPLYKLLFCFLVIELDLPAGELNNGIQLIVDHLKQGKCISIQLLPFISTQFQILLLEQALISVGFPNLENSKFGDIDWQTLTGVAGLLFEIRAYLCQRMMKEAEYVFTYSDLQRMFSSFVCIAKNKVKKIGTTSGHQKDPTTLCGFLNSVAKIIDGFDLNLIGGHISFEEPQEDNEAVEEDEELVECIFEGCNQMFANNTTPVYSIHLIQHQNALVSAHPTKSLTCCFCSQKFTLKSSVNQHIREKHAGLKRKSKCSSAVTPTTQSSMSI